VEIEIWSDFACPWCALGLARLDAARARFEHTDRITVVHRAFELDPRAPARRPLTMEQAVATKYGLSPEHVRSGHERMTAMGREVGVTFDFGRIQLGSTFDAHRLAVAVRRTPVGDPFVRGLFTAHFAEGRLLSDHEVLTAVARRAGVDRATVEHVLEGDAFVDDVRADEAMARELGVTGVPYFVINGKWAIPGAQDSDTMLLVLRRAWERTERTEATTP